MRSWWVVCEISEVEESEVMNPVQLGVFEFSRDTTTELPSSYVHITIMEEENLYGEKYFSEAKRNAK